MIFYFCGDMFSKSCEYDKKKVVLMNKLKILFPLFSILFSNICLGVLPPEYFIARERNAKIKAIAIVKSVKSGFLNKKTGIETQTVTFETISPLTDDKIPKIFTGYCYSSTKQTGYIGGERYYYPKESLGRKVYVSVSADRGQIADFRSVNKKEIIKLKNQFKNRNLLLGQMNVDDLTNSIHRPFDNLYLFKVNGEIQGCLEHKKNKSYPQAYMSELYFKTPKSFKKYSIRTYYSGNGRFQLNEIHLAAVNSPNDAYTITFKYDKSQKPAEGILKKDGEYPAALNTISDFTLFNIVSLLPFDKKQTLSFTLIESLKLNIKKNMEIKFTGRDNGLFKFIQLDSKKCCTAQYWVDKNHILQRVAWDKDKEFIRTNKNFSIKAINSQSSQMAQEQ